MFNIATCQISPLISQDSFWHNFQRYWKEPFSQKNCYGLDSLGCNINLPAYFFLSYMVCRSCCLTNTCCWKCFQFSVSQKDKGVSDFSPLFLNQILMSAHFLTSVSMELAITSLGSSDASVKWAMSWTEAVVTAQVKLWTTCFSIFWQCHSQLLRKFF